MHPPQAEQGGDKGEEEEEEEWEDWGVGSGVDVCVCVVLKDGVE